MSFSRSTRVLRESATSASTDTASVPRPGLILPVAVLILLAGCVGKPIEAERTAREHMTEVGEQLRPGNDEPALPELTAEASLETYTRFAVLNHPAVEAAYYEWRARVEEITPARSLPDPRLTFQADVSDMLMSLMPGLMVEYMTPGKRAAMGREAAAGSEVAYRNYVTAVLTVAANVHKSWIELIYVDETVRLREDALKAIEQSLALSSADYATGSSMTTLETQVRSINSAAEVRSALAALQDRRVATRTRFKSALGLTPDDTDPPWPRDRLSASELPSEEVLWQRAREANPEIASMRSMVDMAIAAVDVAERTRTPDFTLGAMADLKANPLMVRPTASVSLPIWRDKIAATIAAAEARRDAAVARFNVSQLEVAAELAQMFYMVRESDRMIDYIEQTALPNIERILASAQAGLQTGMGRASEIPAARLMELDMRLEQLEALRRRENAVADIAWMTAASAPSNAAVLIVDASQR